MEAPPSDSSIKSQTPEPISNSQNIVIYTQNSELLGRKVFLSATIQGQENLFDSAEIDLALGFWRLGVPREGVHEK
jgi:hypothetical protein